MSLLSAHVAVEMIKGFADTRTSAFRLLPNPGRISLKHDVRKKGI